MTIEVMRSKAAGKLALYVNDYRVGPDAGPWTIIQEFTWRDRDYDALTERLREARELIAIMQNRECFCDDHGSKCGACLCRDWLSKEDGNG